MARERRSSTLCLPGNDPGGTSLLSSWRLQLRGSGGFSPRFPFTKSGKFYTPWSFQCQSAFANNIWLASSMPLSETKPCDAEGAAFRSQ